MPDFGSLLLQNITVLDPGGPHDGEICDISVIEGKIQQVTAAGTLDSSHFAHCVSEATVSPGWVDGRCYLTDPGFEWKEDLKSLGNAAASGGFTTVIAHSLTHPVTDKADLVEALRSRGANLPIHLQVAGVITASHQGQEIAELYDMHQAGAIAFSDGLQSLENAGLVLRTLQYLSSFDGLAILLPMDEGLAAKAQVSEGIVSTHLGLKGVPSISESIRIERDLRLLAYYNPNCRLHLGPITTREGVELVRQAKKRFPRLTAETAALYLASDDSALEGFDPNFKVWPPLRAASDQQALQQGILDGTLDIITTQHHPQGLEDKVNDFVACEMGAAGIETAFSLALQALGKEHLTQIIEAFTHRPRKILGLPEVKVAKGNGAELTVFRPDQAWIPSKATLRSKAVNYPFAGQSLPGEVVGIYAKSRWFSR